MGWAETVLNWMNGLSVIGDSLVTAVGTVVAAVLAVMSGVWTYVATQRRDAAASREERLREQEKEEARRTERIDDLVRALHAEILTGIVLYEDQMDPAQVRHTLFDQTPFATPDEVDFVFESVVDDLSILPSEVIHPVVAYYRAARQINLMIRDFREDRFDATPAAEKKRYMEGYIQLIWILKKRGEEAVAALADYAVHQSIDLTKAEERVRRITRDAIEEASAAIVMAQVSGPEPADDRSDGASHVR